MEYTCQICNDNDGIVMDEWNTVMCESCMVQDIEDNNNIPEDYESLCDIPEEIIKGSY